MVLAGVDDPNGYADQKTPEELAAEVYAELGRSLLAAAGPPEQPSSTGGYCRLGADLTFCGHAHGGIWRLPFTDGLVDTNLHLLPLLHQRLLPLYGRGLPGGGGIRLPGSGQLPQLGLPAVQPAAGGGRHPEKRIEYDYDGNFFCRTI